LATSTNHRLTDQTPTHPATHAKTPKSTDDHANADTAWKKPSANSRRENQKPGKNNPSHTQTTDIGASSSTNSTENPNNTATVNPNRDPKSESI
jgi:hypothetical protein